MMSGILEIAETEAHQKKLERLFRYRELMLPYVFDASDKEFHREEKHDYINRIQRNLIINGRVPQVADIDDL